MMEEAPGSGEAAPEQFRWQALFQRVDEPLFVLNRRRALLFVNHAWQRLTGLSAADARQVVCRRRRPISVFDSTTDLLAYLLCPPGAVLTGESVRVRRLVPGRDTVPRWWDIEFFPLCQEGRVLGILGRILPLPAPASQTTPPLPEKLVLLRHQARRLLDQHLPAGELPAVRRLLDQLHLAGQVRTPVVLVGERGTGKKTLAHLIHTRGPDRERSFAALDCARLPAMAVASLLLADAGAGQCRQMGTLYLAEPGCLPRELQQILWERLVETNDNPAEADGRHWPRLVAGFHGEPLEQIRSGRLLENLFCALDVLRLRVPPLRERLADLPLLVDRCLARANADGGRTIVGLADDAWEVLRRHSWPGNLTELFATLDSARLIASGAQITAADLPAALRLRPDQGSIRRDGPGGGGTLLLDQVMEQVERRLIALALERTQGNRSKAAELLGVLRPRLVRRIQALGLSSSAGEADED